MAAVAISASMVVALLSVRTSSNYLSMRFGRLHLMPAALFLMGLLYFMAAIMHTVRLRVMRVQINMQTGGFRLAIQRKKCHTGNYSVLSDIFHGLCIFYFVSYWASCPVH